MPLPTDDLIIWASSDVNLPNLAGPNKVKPIDDLILKGWDFKQKPAADEFNYVLNNLGMHVSYLEEPKTYTFSGDVTGTVTSTGSDDVTFNVSVTNNSHNHISANISDATSLNTPNMVVRRDGGGNMSANYIRAEAYFFGDLQGNANTASALQTPRTISIYGDGSGSATFSGTSDISIPLVITALSGNSSTATTLQNSKKINGTPFNGSADITTSYWGTSRNFALTGAITGNVSVNGSGDVSLSTSITSSGISILSGTIAHGGTIPLPSGYSEGQCRWMVSMNNDNPSNTAWDWQEGVPSDHIHSYCSANGTRVVTCYRTVLNETGSQTHNGTANYFIIGIK